VPVVITPDYYIGLERYDDNATFIHSTMFVRWTPRLARELRARVDGISKAQNGPLLAASHQPHNGDHAKFAKFVRLMGFEPFATMRGTDGADHAVFIRWS
jgi:hypothetical protein